MAYIISIETTTKNCAVALSKNGQNIALASIATTEFSHAEKLHHFIGEVLQQSTIEYKNLAAIAVSAGPGSYTGLRIGVAAAKGLCFALSIPLIAVDTLTAFAHQLKIEKGLIVPMIDARRMECFTALFDNNYQIIAPQQALIIEDASFFDAWQQDIHILGEAAKYQTLLTDNRFHFHLEKPFPTAESMSELAYAQFLKKDFADVAYFEPFYGKEFYTTASVKK